MARTEARIDVGIWDDPDFLALPPSAQRTFMFFVSQKDLAHTGVIALRERRWSKKAAGLAEAEVRADIAILECARFVVVDDDTEELLVRSFIRRDKVYRQPNVLRAAADHLPLVESPRIRMALREELLRIRQLDMPEGSVPIIAAMLEAIGEPVEISTANPSRDPSPNPSAMPTPGTPEERGVVTAVGTGFPDPRSSVPETTSSSSAAAASRTDDGDKERTKRATRLPMSFEVTKAMRDWAAEKVAQVDVDRETEKFENYWRAKSGKDATKLDWVATWRNWMLNAAERMPVNGARASPAATRPGYTDAYRPSTTDQRVADAQQVGRRLQARLDAEAADQPKELTP